MPAKDQLRCANCGKNCSEKKVFVAKRPVKENHPLCSVCGARLKPAKNIPGQIVRIHEGKMVFDFGGAGVIPGIYLGSVSRSDLARTLPKLDPVLFPELIATARKNK